MSEAAGTMKPHEDLALFFRAGFKSNGEVWERRLYKKLWARIDRLDISTRKRDALRSRRYHIKHKAKATKSHAAWYLKNRRRIARYNRSYHLNHRARHCDFCGNRAGKGRYCLRPARSGLACPNCFA